MNELIMIADDQLITFLSSLSLSRRNEESKMKERERERDCSVKRTIGTHEEKGERRGA
jgi:hypothetical protein